MNTSKIFLADLSKGRIGAAVMVGDSWPNDIVGAGLRAVWLNRYGAACPDPALAVEVTSLEPMVRVVEILKGGR